MVVLACYWISKVLFLLTRLLGDEEDFEEEGSLEQEGLLLEVGNIVLNGVMGSLSNSISDQLEYSIPELAKSNSISHIACRKTCWIDLRFCWLMFVCMSKIAKLKVR